jgi:hypothetical protein
MHSAINFNRTRRLCTSFFLLAGFSLFPCGAQEGQKIALKFVSFPGVADPEPLELLIGEEKIMEVEAPSSEISKPYAVKRQATWMVGKMVTGEDGKSKFEIYGKTKALTSSKQLLLLIRKGKTNAEGFKILALDGRGTQFAGEKFLFLNVAKVDIAGVVGKKKFALKPGAHSILKPKADHGARKNLCHVSFAYRQQKEWKVFSNTTWPVSKSARALVFFYQDPKTRHLRLHTIRDFL